MLVCVALALCFVVSMAYAQDRPKMDGTRVSGVVKSKADDGKSIVVTVKKEEATEDVTLAVNAETKVFVGRDAKDLAAVTVGANVIVVYKKADAGNTALMIRVMTGEGGKKREGERHEG
jgi:hypothetical protein